MTQVKRAGRRREHLYVKLFTQSYVTSKKFVVNATLIHPNQEEKKLKIFVGELLVVNM